MPLRPPRTYREVICSTASLEEVAQTVAFIQPRHRNVSPSWINFYRTDDPHSAVIWAESESQLLYGQSVRLGDKPLEDHRQYFFPTEHLRL
jgi:hypothetical protein